MIFQQVHVLLTKENDPFITLIICDPHKMMQDMTVPAIALPSNSIQNQTFETNVNVHEYLISIIQLPIYLQINLSKAKQSTTPTADTFPKRRQTVRF